MGYSLSRTVITRSDGGKPMFHYGEVVGSGLAASTSINYYPTRERMFGRVMGNAGLDVSYDATAYLFHEFWPDLKYWLKHHGKIPVNGP